LLVKVPELNRVARYGDDLAVGCSFFFFLGSSLQGFVSCSKGYEVVFSDGNYAKKGRLEEGVLQFQLQTFNGVNDVYSACCAQDVKQTSGNFYFCQVLLF